MRLCIQVDAKNSLAFFSSSSSPRSAKEPSIMNDLDGRASLMIVSDLDQTMVDHDDPENHSLLRFNALWESSYRHNSLLVYSTGRSPTLYEKLRKNRPLLTPDITITSVGTEIMYGESMVRDDSWEKYLDQKWNRDIVVEETAQFPQLSLQLATEQRPHKLSFNLQKDHADEVMKTLHERLARRGLNVKFVYSWGIAFDILPQGAGKGQALSYLIKKFRSDGNLPSNILVCGDSGNDAELFSIPDVYGVMVRNAQEELLRWHEKHNINNTRIIHAKERCASAIVEAIGHFGLGPNISPRDVMDLSSFKADHFNPGHEVVIFYLLYERWRRAEVKNPELIIQNMKSVSYSSGIIVHPSGVERSLWQCIDLFSPYYGDKQGKMFRVWLDRVSSSQIGSDAWLVKFDKWELSDEGRHGCVTTILLQSKPETQEGFLLVHVHQTWLEGYALEDQNAWIF